MEVARLVTITEDFRHACDHQLAKVNGNPIMHSLFYWRVAHGMAPKQIGGLLRL